MKKNNLSKTELRRKAEEKLGGRKQKKTAAPTTKVDILRLVQELEVHQIELEMQNDELKRTRAATETAFQQYADLYDFAPVGYFTLARDGAIQKTNFAGANLLGIKRGELIKRRFGLFVSNESRTTFNTFLEKVFLAGGSNKICEVILQSDESAPLWVHIDAAAGSGQECHAAVMDITERKRAEHQASERVKELQAFYGLAEIIEREGITLDDLYRELAQILPNSWQYPEIACARVVMGDGEFRTENFAGSAWMQSAPVKVNGSAVGRIEVGYLEKKPKEYAGPFLKEEQLLLNTIAERLGRITERRQMEGALRESEINLNNLIENTDGSIWAVDPHYGLIVGNEEFHRNIDATLARRLNKGESVLLAAFPSEANAEWRGHYDRALQGESFSIETSTRFRSTPRQVEYRFSPIRNADGKIHGVTVYGRDITERKRVEEALRLSELDLKEAQAVAHIGNWKWDIKKVEITWSDEMYRIFGIDKNSYTGRLGDVIAKVIHPDDLHLVLPSNAPAFAEKKPIEYRIILTDGSIRHIWAKSGEAVVDNGGTPIFLTGVAQDITDRKQAEEALRANESLLRTMAENYPDSFISIIEKDLTVGYTAGQEFKKLNLDPNQFVGLTLEQIFGAHTSFVRENYLKTFDGAETQFELFINDQYQYYRTVPLMDQHGRIARILTVVENITERKQAEEKVAAAGRQVQTILESISDAFFSLNNEMVVTYFNLAAEKALGRRQVDVIGRNLLDAFPEARGSVFEEKYSLALREKMQLSFETYFGIVPYENWYDVNVYPHPEGISVYFQIITERKQAEEALKESEERFRQLGEAAFEGIAVTEKGRVVDGNSQLSRMLGYEFSEMIGKPVSDFIAPESRDLVLAMIRANNEQPYEHLLLRKDGSTFSVESHAKMITWKGKPLRVTALRDITERKRAEDALRESELKYRSLIEASSDAIFCVDEKGQYQFTNQLFASTLGKTPDYFIGKTFWDVYPKEHADYRFEATTRVFQTGESESLEVQVPLPDRTLFFYATANPVKDETGKVILVLTHAVNITARKQAEQELYEAKEKAEEKTIQLLQLENNLKNVMVYQLAWTVMENGEVDKRIGYISDMVTKFYGCTPEQAIADSSLIYNKIHKDDIQRLTDEEAAALKNMMTFDTVVRVFNPNGEIRWSHYISTPRKHAGKIYWDGVEIDVTERKRAEDALRESEDKFQKVFYASPVVVSISSLEDGVFLDANEQFFKITELERKQVIGHKSTEIKIWSDEQRDEIIGEIRERGFVHGKEVELITGSGRVVPLLWYGDIVQIGGKRCLLASGYDLTERKRAEDALRKSEEKYRNLYNNAEVAMFRTKLDGSGFIEVNDKLCDIIGYEREELIGRPTSINWADPSEREKMVRRLKAEGHVKDFEWKLLTKSGAMRNCLASLKLYSGEGILEGSFIDLTERKRAEAERERLLAEVAQKNKELESLVYIASHDMRSPLVTVQGFGGNVQKYCGQISELMEKAETLDELRLSAKPLLEEKIPNALRFIDSGSKKMHVLIEGLLRLSRVGRATLQMGEINMDLMLQNILDTLAFQVETSNAQVIVEKPLAECYGDKNQLNQVFSNLLDNAIKYRNAECSLTVTISSRVEGQKTIYTIADTGMGISPEDQEKIWILFQRVESDAMISGEGLGLTLSQRIVERHGGRIWVESEIGVGSRFHVELPVSSEVQ